MNVEFDPDEAKVAKNVSQAERYADVLSQYVRNPMTRVYDKEGQLNPGFADLADLFTGKVEGPEVGKRVQELELKRLADLFGA
jgi:hypothetical protein